MGAGVVAPYARQHSKQQIGLPLEVLENNGGNVIYHQSKITDPYLICPYCNDLQTINIFYSLSISNFKFYLIFNMVDTKSILESYTIYGMPKHSDTVNISFSF